MVSVLIQVLRIVFYLRSINFTLVACCLDTFAIGTITWGLSIFINLTGLKHRSKTFMIAIDINNQGE